MSLDISNLARSSEHDMTQVRYNKEVHNAYLKLAIWLCI